MEIKSLIDPEAGLVNRRIFADCEIYELERERLFARCWLYLGHESEVPNPGDFVTVYMGEEPVILCRDLGGRLRAFLNLCRHRGNRVCRADRGNAKLFTCSYHGWTYSSDGKLAIVPMADAFHNLDRAQWGLIPVAQIDRYKGLIFATFDAQAPALPEYLGDMAWYLDILLDRREGGTEVSGPHRWLVAANWKAAAENFGGDGYHIASTHGSARELGIDTATSEARKWNKGCQIYCGNGHVLVGWLCPPNDAGPWYAQPSVELLDYMKEHATEIESRLGTTRARKVVPSAGTVFPNLSIHWLTRTIRVWQPRGPDQMEVWSWAIVDRAAPPKIKETMRFISQYRFSPTGVFEQDDMDNWIQVTGAARSVIGKRFPANYQMGVSEEITETGLRGRLSSRWSDSNQLSLICTGQSCSKRRAGAKSRARSMDSDLRHTIEDLLYLEAELLDERRLREWLDLFTDDVHYWMPVRHNPLDRPTSPAEELSKPGESYYFNDSKESLRLRVERLYLKTAWAEMPPSRTRHLISNIRIKKDDGVELEVQSNFIVYRTRMEKDEDFFVGTRNDTLRRLDGKLKIAGRTILLDQAVLSAKNISVFL